MNLDEAKKILKENNYIVESSTTNIIYWNTDTDVMVMPTGLLDLNKIAALDPSIKVYHDVDGMDTVNCGYYGTCSAVLDDINYDPKATNSRVVQCRYTRGKRSGTILYDQPMQVEDGYTLPAKVEEFFK